MWLHPILFILHSPSDKVQISDENKTIMITKKKRVIQANNERLSFSTKYKFSRNNMCYTQFVILLYGITFSIFLL